jgi:hypothetical protein
MGVISAMVDDASSDDTDVLQVIPGTTEVVRSCGKGRARPRSYKVMPQEVRSRDCITSLSYAVAWHEIAWQRYGMIISHVDTDCLGEFVFDSPQCEMHGVVTWRVCACSIPRFPIPSPQKSR